MDLEDMPIGGQKGMEFDEKPIGVGSKAMDFSDAYPPGYDPSTQKFDEEDKPKEKAPLSVRIKSTVFKNRKEAVEELLELFKSTEDINDPIFSEYTALFSKFVSDSNPACLEKGLLAIQLWCQKMDSLSSLTEPLEFIKLIAEKSLPNGKAIIVEACYEIFSIMIEKGMKDDVLNALKMCFTHKNQKVQACSIEATIELLKRFGARKLDYLKPFFPEISKLSDSTISSIKLICMTFFKESFKWVGEAVMSFTDKLKKQQLDELEKFIAEYKPDEPIKPTRQSALQEELELAKGNKGKAGAKIDAYEMATAQDIFSKFNEGWADKVLSIQKWSERKELLDQLIKAASVPKLVPNNFSSIVQLCKKLLNDANVQVQICAIKIAGLMASGIRKPFSSSAKLLSSQLVEKFKDKKQPIVDEALKSLKSFFYCLSLEELVEDIKEALSDKNSGSKVNAINLILQCVEEEKYKNTFKQFFPLLKKLLDDSGEDVRSKTIVLVGKLKGYYTDSFTQSITLNLNAQKMSKIDQYAQQVAPLQTSDPSQYNSNFTEQDQSPLKSKKQVNGQQTQNPANSMKVNKASQSNKGIQKSNSMEIENEWNANNNNGNHANANGNNKIDISREVDRAIIKLSEVKQQSKKEGLDILEGLLQQANYKISPNGLSELVIGLRKCLSESNKSLARQFISFVAKFGESLGKDAKQYSKTLVPGIMQNLQDKQALVKVETMNALDKWAELVGLEQIINFIPPFLGYESLEIRTQLMQYAIKNQEAYLKSELKTFVVPILQSLTDKNKEIRALAEQMLEITLQVVPISHFQDSVKDFKPAVVQQLKSIFEKISDSGNNGAKAGQTNSNHSENNSYGQHAQSIPVNMQNGDVQNSYKSSQFSQKQLSQPLPQTEPPNVQTLKEVRIKAELIQNWPIDATNDVIVEDLIERVKEVGIPQELRLKMFSYSCPRVIEAAFFVKNKISNASQISDLLIKWCFLRLYDQVNIELVKALLDMLKQVFDCLKGENYYLLEFELIIVLNSFLVAIKAHPKSIEIVELIVQAHERLRFISPSIKILKFWIGKLRSEEILSELIILLVNSGLFTSELSNELGTLACIPLVTKSSSILAALFNTYGVQIMQAYGFDLSALAQPKIEIEETQKYKNNDVIDHDNGSIQKKNNQLETVVAATTVDAPTTTEDIAMQEIKQNLHKLLNKDLNLKLYTVHFFNEAFSNPEQIQLMSVHSDYIISLVTKYLSLCMLELRQKEIQYEFFNSFIQLFIKITNTKQFFSSISLSSAKNLSETILTELIQADESKEDKNLNLALKQLNTLMLRVLENTNINNMFVILFDLLITNRKKSEYSKVIAIIIKCILKLTKVLREYLKEVDITQLFLRFHEYMCEFSGDAQKTDDMGIKAIKTMLSEIAKIIDTQTLLEHYKVIEGRDQLIIKMIESITSSKSIHHSPLVKSTPNASVGGGLDKVSQLKLRYAQIITNKSPGVDDDAIQRSIQKINSLNQINCGIGDDMSRQGLGVYNKSEQKIMVLNDINQNNNMISNNNTSNEIEKYRQNY